MLNAPTLWGSVGALESAPDSVVKKLQDPPKYLVQEVGRVLTPFREEVVEAVTASFKIRINKIKTLPGGPQNTCSSVSMNARRTTI
jgi:hypothetical protein